MLPPSDRRLLTGDQVPDPDETTLTGLDVEGILPPALTGRLLRIGPSAVAATHASGQLDGMVHSVELRNGRPVRYCSRWVTTDNIATNVITFGGRTLALGPGALACELDEHHATLGPVDLAGRGRGIGAHPQRDPDNGALHLVSYGDEPAHHVVAPNSQTRITVPVPDAPGPIRDLLLTTDRFVLLGDGFVGVTARASGAAPRWADVELPGAVTAHDLGGDVVVLIASRSLLRWTFEGAGPSRYVLDDTPQRLGTTNPQRSAPTYVWTVASAGGTEVYRHDLRTGDRTVHDLGPGRHPGAMTFVPDPIRHHREDGGWLIGLAHHATHSETDLVVLDAATLDCPPVATIRIPRRVPYGLHGTWIPAVPNHA